MLRPLAALTLAAALSGAALAAPTTPTGLSATPASSSQINLSWTASSSSSAFDAAMLGLHPTHFWSLGDPSGSLAAADSAGGLALSTNAVAFGAAALGVDGRTSAGFNGLASILASSATVDAAATGLQSVFVCFQTAFAQGKLFGIEDRPSGASGASDTASLYIDSDGTLSGGQYDTKDEAVFSTALVTDGKPHCAALTYDGVNLTLYLDGGSVATTPSAAAASIATAYYRVGNGTPPNASWPKTETSGVVNGSIEKAGYFKGTALTASQVAALWTSFSGKTLPAPVITSALSAGGAVGSPFSYQITASNGPTGFDAAGLPAGLSVNTSNGAISGTPSAAGTSSVTISATNAGGTGSAALALTVATSTGLTPPPLVNPQNPGSFGADGSCGTNPSCGDSTTAFQNAINKGDLDVPAGVFKITGSVSVPDGRNIRCESGGALMNQTTASSWSMFNFWGNTSGSLFNCQFRGPNYNATTQPPHQTNFQEFINIQPTSTAGTTGNITISGNDFNGVGGFVGAIMIYANDTIQPPPHNVRIAYNHFENCGYYAVQLTSGKNNSIDHNTVVDCSGFVEADDTGQTNTGNVIDSNHMTYIHGIAMSYSGCTSGCGFNGLTGGSNASGSAFNYSGNTVQNNIVDGTHPSGIIENAAGGAQNDAVYVNNTCTGGCALNVYQ